MHTENGVWLLLFGVLMADIILTPLPGTPCASPFMEAPCDFHSPNFFAARQHLIRPRLDAIRGASSTTTTTSSSSSSALPDVQSCAAHVGNDTQATPQETAEVSKGLAEGVANGGGGDECAGAGFHMVAPKGGEGGGEGAGVTAIYICKCFEMINFTSSLRSKKFMLYDVLKYKW